MTLLSILILCILQVRRLIADVEVTLDSKLEPNIKIFNKVFEDNKGAISLSTKKGVSSGTKHIHTKHWFFKENIGEEKGITIHKIGTTDQIGDIFTKGVVERLFIPLRDRLMGWEE